MQTYLDFLLCSSEESHNCVWHSADMLLVYSHSVCVSLHASGQFCRSGKITHYQYLSHIVNEWFDWLMILFFGIEALQLSTEKCICGTILNVNLVCHTKKSYIAWMQFHASKSVRTLDINGTPIKPGGGGLLGLTPASQAYQGPLPSVALALYVCVCLLNSHLYHLLISDASLFPSY